MKQNRNRPDSALLAIVRRNNPAHTSARRSCESENGEVCVNRLKDLGLNKGLEQLPALRQTLVAVTDRLTGVEADLLNVHADFPVFERLAKPVADGATKIPASRSTTPACSV